MSCRNVHRDDVSSSIAKMTSGNRLAANCPQLTGWSQDQVIRSFLFMHRLILAHLLSFKSHLRIDDKNKLLGYCRGPEENRRKLQISARLGIFYL